MQASESESVGWLKAEVGHKTKEMRSLWVV